MVPCFLHKMIGLATIDVITIGVDRAMKAAEIHIVTEIEVLKVPTLE